MLTGGKASDYTAFDPLMTLSLPKPKARISDKGYDSDKFRESLLMRGILPIIHHARTAKTRTIPTVGATAIATALSRCSENLSRNDALPPATTKPSSHSKVSLTLPLHA